MLVGEVWDAITLLCMQTSEKKKKCPYLVQDCERISADEDLNLAREKT